MPMVFLRHARWIDKNPRHLVIVPVKSKRKGRHQATELSCGPSGEIVPGAFRSGECRGISNFLFLIRGGVGYGNTAQSRLWAYGAHNRRVGPIDATTLTILICQSPFWLVYIARPPSFAKILRTVHGQFGPFPTHGSLNSLIESTKFRPFRPHLAG